MSPKRSEKKTQAGSKTNFRYLSTPEKRQRYSNVRAEMEANKRKVEQLKAKVTKMTKRDGILIDEDLDKDLREIMMDPDNTDEIMRKYGADSFECVLWQQQKEAASQKQRSQIRWHPMLIRWCLHLIFISSSAYDALRSSGIIILPSERTLRDYSNWMPAKPGFTPDVDRQLMKEAKIDEIPEYTKYVCLTFDEVKVKEGLVYNKESMEIIGFVNVADISEHLHAYERSCNQDDCYPKPQIATHTLMFMLFSGLCFPYAQFPCTYLSGDQLYPLVWECVSHLEMIGFKVLAMTADGASCNRKFMSMLQESGAKKSDGTNGLVYKVDNIYAPDNRPIFLFSDVPHLIKTTRNCWSNSFAHRRSRMLWVSHYSQWRI